MAPKYKQSRRLEGRNGKIWREHTFGKTAEQLAEEYEMTEANVYRIFAQVKASIPPDEQADIRKIRKEVLDDLKSKVMALAERAYETPAPAFAPNGKPHFDPATGGSVYDYSTFLNAVAAALKLDERIGKLTGTDSAVTHTVSVTAEAQQATVEAANKVGKSLGSLFAQSAEVAAHAARN
jgi:hypothetical protein